MLEVTVVYDDEYNCNDLIILHNGKEIARHSDGMEPEDALFYRDLSWVPEEILEAYRLGKKDGKEEKDGI